jgi:cyclic beta-1,2-glucan synthetase
LSSDEPIRSELFSVERLEQHAETLAAAQHVTAPRSGTRAEIALSDNARVLVAAYRCARRRNARRSSDLAGAEWLLDNFHIVEEQIREIKQDLPRLLSGVAANLPMDT